MWGRVSKHPPLSLLDFLRHFSTFAVFFSLPNLSPALCITTFFRLAFIVFIRSHSFVTSTLGDCLVSLESLPAPYVERPSLHNIPAPSAPPAFAQAVPFAWHAVPSFFCPTNLPFKIGSTVPSLENLHWPFPSTPRKNWVFSSLSP